MILRLVAIVGVMEHRRVPDDEHEEHVVSVVGGGALEAFVEPQGDPRMHDDGSLQPRGLRSARADSLGRTSMPSLSLRRRTWDHDPLQMDMPTACPTCKSPCRWLMTNTQEAPRTGRVCNRREAHYGVRQGAHERNHDFMGEPVHATKPLVRLLGAHRSATR